MEVDLSSKLSTELYGGDGGSYYAWSPSDLPMLHKALGDAIALPFSVVTWWYNGDDTELIVLFLGETSEAHKVGEFTNFFLTASNCIFTGFSTEFVGGAWHLEEDKVKALVASQTGSGIVKLPEGIKMPEPNKEERDGMALNCLEAPLDVDINNGGTSLNSRVIIVGTSLNSRFALAESDI